MAGEPMNVEAVFAEIRGDVKRIFDHMQRHSQDVARIDERLNHHGTRLTALETNENQRVGMGKAVRVMWVMLGGSGGVIVTGVAAVIARAKGL